MFFPSFYLWKGREKRGISVIQRRKKSVMTLFYFVSIFLVYIFCYGAAVRFGEGKVRSALNVMGLGTFYLLAIIQSALISRRIKKLTAVKSVSSRFGIDTESLTTFAEENGIKPRYNINGEDFYDLKDFGEAATLLRASVAPAAEPDTLLRPAANRTETLPVQLLRPSVSPDREINRQNAKLRNG